MHEGSNIVVAAENLGTWIIQKKMFEPRRHVHASDSKDSERETEMIKELEKYSSVKYTLECVPMDANSRT